MREPSLPPAGLRWNRRVCPRPNSYAVPLALGLERKKKRKTSGSLAGDLPAYSATAGAQSERVCVCVVCAWDTAVASHPVTSRLASDAVPPLCPSVFPPPAGRSGRLSLCATDSVCRWPLHPEHKHRETAIFFCLRFPLLEHFSAFSLVRRRLLIPLIAQNSVTKRREKKP